MPLKRTAGGLTPVSESSKYIIGYLGTVDLDDAALRKEVVKARSGDDCAMNTIISAVIKRIHWIAARCGRPEMMDDLVQEGALAIMTAVERFDAEKAGNSSFVSYATLWAKSRMRNALALAEPVRSQDKGTAFLSFDAMLYEDSDKALHETIPSTYPTPYAAYRQEEDVKTMYELLDKLSREEKDAIMRVLGLGDGGKERNMDVAASCGVSKNAITNRVKRGIKRMRAMVQTKEVG
jgi:RNA polymerase sigma factor (sigma-70 family)